MTLSPEIEAYGDYVASLPNQSARDEAKAALRQYVMAQIPVEQLDEGLRLRSLGEYLDQKIETPPMLVEPGLVARGAISSLTSRAGKGKTALSLNRLVRWSMGKPLFDELPDVMKPTEPLRCLLIENEGAPGHFQKCLGLVLYKNGYSQEDIDLARENITIWGDGGWSNMKLDNDENVALLSNAAAKVKADIVFVEPFRGLWAGEENSSTDMQAVLDSMSQIANENMCGLMITHHETKGGADREEAMDAARGSTAFEGAAAVMERWKGVGKESQQRSELSWVKWRFDEPPAPVRMEFHRDTWSYTLVTEGEEERGILKLLSQFPSDYFDLHTIREDLELKSSEEQTLRRRMRKLVEDGRLRERKADGKAQWCIKTDDNGGGTLSV